MLHAGTAVQHEVLKRDNLLRRMLGVLPMTPERQATQNDPAERDEYAGLRLLTQRRNHRRQPMR